MKFSHLHVHTQFSLLDGAASIQKLYKKAIEDKMPALAISDHGNMFGVFEFVAEAYKHTDENGNLKVKPIVGCEFYITKDRHRKSFTKEEKDPRHHQILLAKNEIGYRNLIKLTSLGFIEGLYSKYPRIDKELILQYHEGLIATTCCLGALVPQLILKKSESEAEKEFQWWLELFGEDYYVELQRHGMKDQDTVNEVLLKFALKHNVKIIASNDSHYVDVEDFTAHDILLCINTGEKQATPPLREFSDDDVHSKGKRFAFPNDQFYFKKTEEMIQVFKDLPQAIDNTNEIVDKISLLDLKKDILLPAFPIPTEFELHQKSESIGKSVIAPDALNQWEYLKHITYEGAKKRYSELSTEIIERIDFELFTIKTMGFAGYFLIVSDFIKAGRDMNVFVGPGRGSVAGSVVAYCINITNIDPIKYNLLFERFLNPDRKSMPDIDTDFDDIGRQKVIDYVVKKYGKNQVAQIITYGTMAAKMSIKDVARVMDLPLADSNILSKLVPDRAGIELKRVLHAPLTIEESRKKSNSSTGEKSLEEKDGLLQDDLEKVKKIREIYKSKSLESKVLHEAEILEGSVRNKGIHASAIIIAPRDLTELIPISTAKDSPLWITQIDGNLIESAGILKMDFLGLNTLTIIKDALTLIKKNHGVTVDIETIPLNDEKTFQLFQQGATIGTFQFESPGMQKELRELKPDKFEDLIAMNALYRPGPMAYIPSYIARKHGREVVTYDLPEMEEHLKETYGITVYQEQVMLLAQKLANFSKGDADVLRKAMGKKQKSVLDKMKGQFISGGSEKGFGSFTLEKIWKDWEAFAEYAFNKSHATCYAFVAYQTAYLKKNYPNEYMSSVLNQAGSIEKLTFYMDECKRMGIKVLGPDINESDKGFAVNTKGEIRFGLNSLKGAGEAAVENIINEREKNNLYKDIFDFIERVNQRSVNKRTLESLIYAGAFDCFKEHHRAQFFETTAEDTKSGMEKIIAFGNAMQSSTTATSNTLFGDLPSSLLVKKPLLTQCLPWPLTVQLEHEKEVAGIYLSGHPLDHFKFEIENYGITPLTNFNELKESMKINPTVKGLIRLAGLSVDAQHRVSKKGNKYGSLIIEDFSGKSELFIHGDDYIRFMPFIQKGNSLFISGQFTQRYKTTDYEFKVRHITTLESVKRMLTKQVSITTSPENISEELIDFLVKNMNSFPGKASLQLILQDRKNNLKINLQSSDACLEMNDELIDYLYSNPAINIHIKSD
ncbi:MAG: DNA polymerase III subunit alpha [Chitinophagaceae bacterium]|nr:MAG: DNA polymerase III subunit alpha [Chitinophagaceae bacterium]